MADIRSGSQRESVCISCNRILDSCRDKDCFENVRVYLDNDGQQLVEKSGAVRVKCCEVAWTQLDVDSVQFNRGFYTVNVRFYARVVCECCVCPGHTQETEGVAVCEKKVILYGGEGGVSTFRSNPSGDSFCSLPPSVPEGNTCCDSAQSLPQAVCEVADPVVLDAKIVQNEECSSSCCNCNSGEIPNRIWRNGAPSSIGNGDRVLTVSLGFFSVIRLERPAQFVVNASEYSVPDKECCEAPENDPCSMFRRMQFPTSEFSPTSASGGGCSSCNS